MQDGYYTGRTKVNMALDQEKRKIIKGLIRQGFDQTHSFAFGDNRVHDRPLLSAVGNAFIIGDETQQRLAKIALKNNWTIVNASNILEKVQHRINQIF